MGSGYWRGRLVGFRFERGISSAARAMRRDEMG